MDMKKSGPRVSVNKERVTGYVMKLTSWNAIVVGGKRQGVRLRTLPASKWGIPRKAVITSSKSATNESIRASEDDREENVIGGNSAEITQVASSSVKEAVTARSKGKRGPRRKPVDTEVKVTNLTAETSNEEANTPGIPGDRKDESSNEVVGNKVSKRKTAVRTTDAKLRSGQKRASKADEARPESVEGARSDPSQERVNGSSVQGTVHSTEEIFPQFQGQRKEEQESVFTGKTSETQSNERQVGTMDELDSLFAKEDHGMAETDEDDEGQPLWMEEDDPTWPDEGEDGWGFRTSQFFEDVKIKPQKKSSDEDDSDDEDDDLALNWETEADEWIIKEITSVEWEATVFADPSPLLVYVFARYGRRGPDGWNMLKELEKAVQTIWDSQKAPLRAVKVDAGLEMDLASAIRINCDECPVLIFIKNGKLLYSLKGIRTSEELLQLIAHFFYNGMRPACLEKNSAAEQLRNIA